MSRSHTRRPTSSLYAAAVAADNPVAWWRLGELSGTTVRDEKNTYNGTYTGGPTLGQPGRIFGNTAVTWNGSTQWADVGNPTAIFTGDMTMECWVKAGAITGTAICFASTSGSAFLGLRIVGGPSAVAFIRNDAGVAVTLTGSTSVTDGNWHHIAVTKTGTTFTLFVDGISEATNTATGVFTFTGCTIASNQAHSSGWFNGSLDEPALFASALPQARLAAHAAAGIR